MYSLALSVVNALVRKNLDEIGFNDSDIIGDTDSSDLDAIIAKTLPEAINVVHLAAPVEILDGLAFSKVESLLPMVGGLLTASINDDLSVDLTLKAKYLRLVSFKAADSSYVLSSTIDEVSPEGRMQYNPYTRGTYDNPKLILLQGKSSNADNTEAKFKYFSLSKDYETDIDSVVEMTYLPRYDSTDGIETTDGDKVFMVASSVRENIIDTLTSMVLQIYGNAQQSSYFLQKGSFTEPTPVVPTEA